jgi:hypothetical protein
VSAGRRTTSKRQERSCGLRRFSQGIYLIGREPVIMKDTDESPRALVPVGGEATLETAIRAPSVSSSVNLQRSCQSLGGRENQPIPHNAGNYYRNHARHVAGITSLIRIEIANCPHISSSVISMADISGCGFCTQYSSSSDLQCQSLWLVETPYGPRSASRLSRLLSADGSCGTRAEAYAIVGSEVCAHSIRRHALQKRQSRSNLHTLQVVLLASSFIFLRRLLGRISCANRCDHFSDAITVTKWRTKLPNETSFTRFCRIQPPVVIDIMG